MIKTLALSSFIYTVIFVSMAVYKLEYPFAMGVGLGGFAVLFNLISLAAFWHLIFSKKLIALAATIIIFKYLILAIILWSLMTFKVIDPTGFCTGLASLLFGVLVLLFKKSVKRS